MLYHKYISFTMKSYLRKVLLVSLFVMFGLKGFTQEQAMEVVEDSLKHYFELLASETHDDKKTEINNQIVDLFKNGLQHEESFYYPFYDLKNIGLIRSEDSKLRIVTWNLPYQDRTHKYFGFIQHKKNKRSYEFYELKDKSNQIENPELQILSTSNWYGALYYKIITNKYRGKEYYTILGADLNNLLTKKKIIEILYFDEKDIPVFGEKVFKNKVPPSARVIFEFSGQVNMTLAYDEEKEIIVFDHLSPSRPSLVGQFEFYGPDFSYDGLKFERGIWNYYPDIDVRDYSIEEF